MPPIACADFRNQAASRRDALRAGALAMSGLGLPELFRARASGAPPRRAKACILIFMWGGPSHLDTWDPKPDAPAEIRGPFQPIATKTPGLLISEHFPRLAQQTDRLAVIRSMTHDDPAHLSTAHRLLTGHLAPRPKSDADGPSTKDWPFLGSILAKVRPKGGAMPQSVLMPWTVAHPAAPGGKAPGQHGGWLGTAYDPFRIEGDPNHPNFKVAGTDLPDGVSELRLRSRRQLLSGLDTDSSSKWSPFQTRALDALASAEARGAFQIDREDPRVRDRYGRNIHGQCLLMARRLIESGVELVTVNWHNDGQNFWDTHGDNFNQLKNRLMPPADQGFAALLDDLHDRGMLDDTLVAWVGEFGRTPRIINGSGREHWPRCYSGVLAGGGIQGGQVYGASDRWGAYPAQNPVSPEDFAATLLHGLGVDPATEIFDPEGRPMRINPGEPLAGLFA